MAQDKKISYTYRKQSLVLSVQDKQRSMIPSTIVHLNPAPNSIEHENLHLIQEEQEEHIQTTVSSATSTNNNTTTKNENKNKNDKKQPWKR